MSRIPDLRGPRTNLKALALGCLLLPALLGGCNREGFRMPVATESSSPPATPSPVVAESPSAEPSASPAPEPVEKRKRPPRSVFPLTVGSEGRAVLRVQRTLARISYEPGNGDAVFGVETQHAVYAFEKVHGLELDGAVGRRDFARIIHAERPKAPKHPGDRYVDVDIERQVLFEVEDGRVTKTLSISTGNGQPYESHSGTAIATTPRGEFSIQRKIPEWRVGYLGAMYYPSYFYGGYAVHGSGSVPPYPASHGCVRIPMHSTVGFYERNPVGTTIIVHD